MAEIFEVKAGATRAGREIQVEMTKMTCGHSLYQMHCVFLCFSKMFVIYLCMAMLFGYRGNIPSLYGYVGWLQREYTLLKGLADVLQTATAMFE